MSVLFKKNYDITQSCVNFNLNPNYESYTLTTPSVLFNLIFFLRKLKRTLTRRIIQCHHYIISSLGHLKNTPPSLLLQGKIYTQ